jgi:putative oxidoreductase
MVQNLFTLAGRWLLAAYFALPGLMKVFDFDGTAAYMAAHGMVLVPVFLVLTIVMQIGGAFCLAVGYRVRLTSFLLAGLVLVISCVMHDFWNITDALQQQHETQNFIKNMAIMAGLMVLAGGNGAASTGSLITSRT